MADVCEVAGGRGHGLCGATRVARTCSASEGGCGRFASDGSMGAGGPPTAGGTEERGVAPARSIAIASKYKLIGGKDIGEATTKSLPTILTTKGDELELELTLAMDMDVLCTTLRA